MTTEPLTVRAEYDRLLAELAESPLPGARYAHEVVQRHWPAILAALMSTRFGAAISTTPAPLDAAWNAAEAALPGGWRLRVTRSDEDFGVWEASAVSPAFFEGENDNDAECAIGEADTPAAALLALAEKLRSTP